MTFLLKFLFCENQGRFLRKQKQPIVKFFVFGNGERANSVARRSLGGREQPNVAVLVVKYNQSADCVAEITRLSAHSVANCVAVLGVEKYRTANCVVQQ